MGTTKSRRLRLTILLAFLLCGCGDSTSSEEQEDAQFEAQYQEAKAYALSPANVAKQRANNAQSSGSSGGGGGSFVWKPQSESNGRLVVLLPASYAGVQSITVVGSGGRESASRSAIANGGRPHYRFSRSGGAYGHNITVTGGGRLWHVSNGASRVDL